MAESSGAAQRRRRVLEHDIFLSHSGQQKPFVEQLFHDLKGAGKHPFFDQDSDSLPKAELFPQNILNAAEECQMGVVVLSEDYLKSKWPMLELSKFVESNVRLFPLFFKLSPSDLSQDDVESRWKPAWRNIGMKEELVELWSKAMKVLRASNGLEYEKYAKSEYKYREDVVREICKLLPPILKWKIDYIQGCERLCTMVWPMFGRKESCEYLGLYGMAGAGKSTLCKAMCNYSQAEFGANVFLLDLTSGDSLSRLKTLLEQMGVTNITLSKVATIEQGFGCLDDALKRKRIFLAIDNVVDSRSSIDEVRSYLSAKLPFDSKVLVTSRSKDILQAVFGSSEQCKQIPRLAHIEARELFLSIAAPKKSTLTDEENEIVERCLSKCRFVESGYPTEVYQPLILRALGVYLNKEDSWDVLKWQRALESNNILSNNSEEGREVHKMLGLNYETLSNKMKLVFLDTALYPNCEYGDQWWVEGMEGFCYSIWASWISGVHATTTFEANKMLADLQRVSLLEDSSWEELSRFTNGLFRKVGADSVKPPVHDLYKDFAKGLVEIEGSKEWEWWMGRISGSMEKLKRMVLKEEKSLVGRASRRFHKWRGLEFLELQDCNDIGVLELGGLSCLRVLVLRGCKKLQKIVYNCKYGMEQTDLCSVILEGLVSIEDTFFLKNFKKIKTLRVLDCNGSIYPTTHGSEGVVNLSHLEELQTLIMWDMGVKVIRDAGAFFKWFYTAMRLKKLEAFEYQIKDREIDGGGDEYTITLSELLGQFTSQLSVLSLRLPWHIKELEGLYLLSKLTKLNLNMCQGLRRLPDLQRCSKLKSVCLHGCHELVDPLKGCEVQEILCKPRVTSKFHGHKSTAINECFELKCDHEHCSHESITKRTIKALVDLIRLRYRNP